MIYQIFQQRQKLEEAEKRLQTMPIVPEAVQSSIELSPDPVVEEEEIGEEKGEGRWEEGEQNHNEVAGGNGGDRGERTVPMYWVKRETMANILAEDISEKQVSIPPSNLPLITSSPINLPV